MKTIEIIVDQRGETRLETRGFQGSTCQDATRLLEKALGTVASDKPTAEFYSQPTSQTQQIQE